MKPTKPSSPAKIVPPMPRALDYPHGWTVDTTHGQLQSDGTRAGRLARLADVARFVMARYDLPPVEVTAWLCDALEAAQPALYLLSESGRAVALPPDHSFAWVPFSWDVQPAPKPADCGLPGAVKHMREYWDSAEPGKAGYVGESLLDPLAIRLDDAFALWGFGTLEPAHQATGDVQPLAEWQQNTAHGFMGCDSTPAGRLVRLADLVRWLEAGKALPRSKAVEALCDGLHAGALGALYRVRPGEYADRQPPNHAYGYKTCSEVVDAQRRAAAQRGGSAWSAAPTVNWVTGKPSRQSITVRKPAVQPTPVAPGLAALLRRIRESWGGAPGARKGAGDVLDATTGELAALAITLDMAYALWGWGDVAQVVQLQSVPKADADAEAAPAKATSYDWSNAKTQAALLAAFKSASGNSARDKAAYLATTEKWGRYSAETLRKKATALKKNGVVEVKSKDADLSKVWGNTQRKS